MVKSINDLSTDYNLFNEMVCLTDVWGIVCLLLVNVADTDTVVGSMSLVFGILSPARLLSHALPCLLVWFDLMLL